MKTVNTILVTAVTVAAICDENNPPTTSSGWVQGSRNKNMWYFSEKFSSDWMEFIRARPRDFNGASDFCTRKIGNFHLRNLLMTS